MSLNVFDMFDDLTINHHHHYHHHHMIKQIQNVKTHNLNFTAFYLKVLYFKENFAFSSVSSH